MEPDEALSTAAQIAVTLAGFASVVVIFRRESIHELSPINKFRLRQLLTNSILPLALCMIGLLFLTIRPVPADIWRWCSGAAFVILLLFGRGIVKVFRRFDLQELHRAGASRSIFYLTGAVGIAATLLQLYNGALLNAFSPLSGFSSLPPCPSLCGWSSRRSKAQTRKPPAATRSMKPARSREDARNRR